jgi:alkylation response protein AidB-like acyl-CoA dehydrogenase
MDLLFSESDEQYRRQVRGWLKENAADFAAMAKAKDPVQAARDWQLKMYEAGYVGLTWPESCGGQEATLTQQVVLSQELAHGKIPHLINTIALTTLGPTLIQHGTERQRQRFLPKILSAEEIWCQGFSEPGAGSDLPSLKTKAVLEGDEFIVNGQKVWTSLAPIADWCFLLVRTDPEAPKREGITYLLCDMKTPGVTVQPLRNAGGGFHFSEVFFDEVRIPRENCVGEINGGWKIARSTLEHERSGLSGIIALEGNLARQRQMAADIRVGNKTALDKDSARQKLAQYWIEIEGLRHLGYRALSDQIAGRQPGASASVGKLFGSKLRQKIANTSLELAGPLTPVAKKSPYVIERGRLHAGYFDALGYSIGGGTSEIMHNTIAERILGLPHSTRDD